MKERKTISKDYAIRNAVFELMPTEKTQGRLKEEIPGTDLSIIYAIDLQADGISAEIKVPSARYDWVTEMKEAAKENTEKLRPLNIFKLEDMVGLKDDGTNILVVTTATCIHGAAAILYPGIDEEIRSHEGFEKGYFIIPSSIHEVLVIAKEIVSDANELKEIVLDVNQNYVAPDEVLSNNIFELVNGKLTVVC